MKVYLAGKISKNCWRHSLVPDLRGYLVGNCIDSPYVADERVDRLYWDELPTIFDGVSCVGPYFASCDHGCYHGDGSHGLQTVEGQNIRNVIARLCSLAIRQADLVFAWISGKSLFIVEPVSLPECDGSDVPKRLRLDFLSQLGVYLPEDDIENSKKVLMIERRFGWTIEIRYCQSRFASRHDYCRRVEDSEILYYIVEVKNLAGNIVSGRVYSAQDFDCYGTIAELGYAAALGKPVRIGSCIPIPDFWLIHQLSFQHVRIIEPTPKEALSEALKQVGEIRRKPLFGVAPTIDIGMRY